MSDMKPYIVRQGDYLTRITYVLGVDPQEVWDHPKNLELHDQRKDWDILCPGDVLHLPEREADRHDVSIRSQNQFRGSVPLVNISMVLRGANGDPLERCHCRIHGVSDEVIECDTDGDGKLEVAVPVLVRYFHVVVEGQSLALEIDVGGMDPWNTESGLLQRLTNLGYCPGPEFVEVMNIPEHLYEEARAGLVSQALRDFGASCAPGGSERGFEEVRGDLYNTYKR